MDSDGLATRYVVSGCVRVKGHELWQRLETIFRDIQSLVREHAPDQIVVEKVFMHRNADSALKLGQARAAAICATFGGEVELFEYTAREVKQAIVGRGGAAKLQVQHMVKALLNLDAVPLPDEADALAVAICHAHRQPMHDRLAAVQPGQRESAR